MTKGAKANTPRQQSNRWTIQLNSKSVSDWRRSSRRPRKGRMVRLYRYSSTSSTSTRRCSYLDTWYSNRQQSSYVHHELFQFRARSESRMLSVCTFAQRVYSSAAPETASWFLRPARFSMLHMNSYATATVRRHVPAATLCAPQLHVVSAHGWV